MTTNTGIGLRDLAGYFLRLGTFGFGGPIALAGYMQRDLVERRRWFTQEEYLQGLAVSQTLPGPLAAQLAMWLGYVRRGFWGAVAAAVPFILPPFVIVSIVAALYVSFRGTTVIQALFYGIGPTVIALILRGAWKLLGVTVKNDRRLWAIFAVVTLITFAVRSEVAVLFVLAGFLGVLLYAPPGWLRRPAISPAAIPLGLGTLVTQAADPNVLLQLGIFFFKAGAFTFGSGLAIVPFLQQGVVRDYGWLTEREFLDAVAMGMITPGPVVITAVFVGYLVAGLSGAAIAAAAAGAIVGAAAVIATQFLVDVPTIAIFVIAFGILWRLRVPEPALVAASAIVGLVLFGVR